MDLRRAVGCGVDQPARNFTAMADGPSTAQDPVAMDMAERPLRMLCPDMQGIGTTCLKYSQDSADQGPGSTMSDGPSTTTEPVAMDMAARLEDHGVITPTLDSCRSISTIIAAGFRHVENHGSCLSSLLLISTAACAPLLIPPYEFLNLYGIYSI